MVAGMAILVGGPMGAAGVIATGILLSGGGPIGLGADGDSWDCWRAVLRDFEGPTGRGRPLKDVLNDSRVVEVRNLAEEGHWPQYWLKNQWEEEFRIDYVQLEGGEIAAHATRLEL